ncbi:MAG: radical SAM protein, partial [Myxococcota bacterium]|nr:radical SAM protein [Myxococcota bacterium]
MSHSDWARPAFDPMANEAQLTGLIGHLIENPPDDQRAWRIRLKAHPKAGGGFFAKAEILAGFRAFAPSYQWAMSEREFITLLKLRPTRTLSGVTPVTVLTKPFPCPGQCIFCPNDVRMPKSYLSEEPGALQAAHNRFDPYTQTWNRILSFYDMGHPVDKIEFIILGGSWSAYPRAYQRYFIARCFEAMNDFGETPHPTRLIPVAKHQPDFFDLDLLENDSPEPGATVNVYNHTVGKHLRANLDGQLTADHEEADWARVEVAQTRNETARCRVVGLVIETRPDMIDADEVVHLRRLGATKIQIGIQSMSDDILQLNRRGHDVDTSRRALALLRRAGFKIHAHWMANLFGATPTTDSADFQRLFSDPSICPDELKLYPCALIPKTELMSHFDAGRWTPYTRQQLLDLLCQIMPTTPPYCRLSRVIRDIPSIAIHAGNQETNFR